MAGCWDDSAHALGAQRIEHADPAFQGGRCQKALLGQELDPARWCAYSHPVMWRPPSWNLMVS